jgi:hypothetical protein
VRHFHSGGLGYRHRRRRVGAQFPRPRSGPSPAASIIRDLSGTDYVYLWVDGIHLKVRLEKQKLCLLVMLGVRSDGRKELVALADGSRESTESWADLLRDCRRRGMVPLSRTPARHPRPPAPARRVLPEISRRITPTTPSGVGSIHALIPTERECSRCGRRFLIQRVRFPFGRAATTGAKCSPPFYEAELSRARP